MLIFRKRRNVVSQFAGTTTYDITDANGCSTSTSIALSEPAKWKASTSTTPSSCSSNDGTATVNATGGNINILIYGRMDKPLKLQAGLPTGDYTVSVLMPMVVLARVPLLFFGSRRFYNCSGVYKAVPAGACQTQSGIVLFCSSSFQVQHLIYGHYHQVQQALHLPIALLWHLARLIQMDSIV
ncbi:MAG: hypothetical protein IPN88_12775 [Bacteroidetes bacterium]|nr:hypothetical protein [Bacteroidota bacterium]